MSAFSCIWRLDPDIILCLCINIHCFDKKYKSFFYFILQTSKDRILLDSFPKIHYCLYRYDSGVKRSTS